MDHQRVQGHDGNSGTGAGNAKTEAPANLAVIQPIGSHSGLPPRQMYQQTGGNQYLAAQAVQ
jgi:hypothetical protein